MAKKDICVLGLGRFGTTVVTQLVKLKRHVFAIDANEKNVKKLMGVATNVAVADATDINALTALGVQSFDIVIVAMADNVDIAATLMELKVKHIIAKANSERHARVLRQIGVQSIVFPEAEAGLRTAMLVTHSAFMKYSKTIEEIGGGFGMASVVLKKENYINKTIMQVKFNKLQVNVVFIKRQTKVYLPTGKTQLYKNDLLTLIGKIDNLAKAMTFLGRSQYKKKISNKEKEIT